MIINTTYITETISTAMDIFSLFIKSALLMDVTQNIHYNSSKKDPDWHNVTNNDNPPPPDDDTHSILKRRYEGEEWLEPHDQIPRGVDLPCIDINHPNDEQPLQPALLGLSPISL